MLKAVPAGDGGVGIFHCDHLGRHPERRGRFGRRGGISVLVRMTATVLLIFPDVTRVERPGAPRPTR
ncbi:hypothetical protein FRUB_06792 [Fimbriiglobus ruber]|uniref:Uncharacterized protein n=1 Tax=Fimbriiglobus ruber TaxID=1908690 RepID=A0A225D888_9BACT|nr:hypothetical protein FRUB_06792 [Fimbriiglobus ruber]